MIAVPSEHLLILYSVNFGVVGDYIRVLNASKYTLSDIKVSASFRLRDGSTISLSSLRSRNGRISRLAAIDSKELSIERLNSGILGHNVIKYNVSIDFKYRNHFSSNEIKGSTNQDMTELIRQEAKFINRIKGRKSAYKRRI